jgi:ankyrin repeat protein
MQSALKRSQHTALERLTFAVTEGDLETVKVLLARGLPFNAGDYDNRTTIHLAVKEGQAEVTRTLLDKGARVDLCDSWGNTPLHDALNTNQLKVAEWLVAKGACLSSNNFVAIMDAAQHEPQRLKLLVLRAGVDANSCDYDRRSVLHVAVASKHLAAVQHLLTVGANVNVTDRWGGTPMDDAVQVDDVILFNLLKTYGAKSSPSFQKRAIMRAAQEGNARMLDLLVDSGADLATVNYNGVWIYLLTG